MCLFHMKLMKLAFISYKIYEMSLWCFSFEMTMSVRSCLSYNYFIPVFKTSDHTSIGTDISWTATVSSCLVLVSGKNLTMWRNCKVRILLLSYDFDRCENTAIHRELPHNKKRSSTKRDYCYSENVNIYL